MGSGSPRSRSESRAGAASGFPLGALVAICLLLASAPLLGSCSAPAAGFPAALAAIDALQGPAPRAERAAAEARLDKAFAAAYRSAQSSSNWLSLLKRAAEREAPAALECAAAALKAAPGSEPVAAAAAHIFLRTGYPERALSLFSGGVLKPESRPELWAEAFLAARKAKRPAPELNNPEASARLGRILGEPAFLAEAALLSLGRGDRFAAAAYLRAALEAGASPPAALLWDAGLAAELSAREPSVEAGAKELLLAGDAALLAGDVQLARRRWEAGLELLPRASWKALSKLALYAPDRDSGLEAARRLARDFPAEPGARRFAAAYFLRNDREEEARSLLKGPAAEEAGASGASAEMELLRLSLEGRKGPEARLLAESLRLLESKPDSPLLREASLRLLLERGRFGDFLTIFDSGEARGFESGSRWYYAAAALALRGNFPAAAELLEREAPAFPGPEGAFALGLIYAELGDYGKALERLEIALSSARSAGERAAVLKEVGRNQGRLGQGALAAASYRAAARADPGDAEAAFLADSK